MTSRRTDAVEKGPIEALPGFRRRILIQPAPGRVTAELEDDYHRMTVEITHEGGVATTVWASMARAPWTTCPGAELQLPRSFTGRLLADFGVVGEREQNCTHLQDLALLAAAHAADASPMVIDILVSDPVDGAKQAELQRNGAAVLQWRMEGNLVTAPAAIAGRGLHQLGDWIAGLDESTKEAARLLRWGTMISGGRLMVIEKVIGGLLQGRCYTFQPDRFAAAERLGEIIDFSVSGREVLADRPVSVRAATP